jgi:hypothetical protein
MFGFRNFGREGCFGRRVVAYLFNAEGDVTVIVCEIPY